MISPDEFRSVKKTLVDLYCDSKHTDSKYRLEFCNALETLELMEYEFTCFVDDYYQAKVKDIWSDPRFWDPKKDY